MPYYAYIDLDGNCQSPNNTFDPSEINSTSTKYRKVSKPLINPVYDTDTDKFRTMTSEEVAIQQTELAESKLQADIASLNVCSKLELSEAMTELDEINNVTTFTEMFNSFKSLPKFDLTHEFKFNHDVVIQAMENIETSILMSIKEQIVKNRSV